MTRMFTDFKIMAESEAGRKAAGLFREEMSLRTGREPAEKSGDGYLEAEFIQCGDMEIENKDTYMLDFQGSELKITACGLRGMIFGFSYFLRKTVFENGCFYPVKDITGVYAPAMRIRGHQLGYRTTPNTYDAWSLDDYYRYYRDMMFFGCNTCEHIPGSGTNTKSNCLMKYPPDELFYKASELADSLDMDVSVWYPNEEESISEAVENRRQVFEKTPRIDAVFPPGGDPGELPAGEFVQRCAEIAKVLREIHPNAQMWPSAQKPRVFPDWGEEFIEEMEKLPSEIDGVITGPNRAFPLDELRRRLPAKYPIRLYPDITHNVRCEYPVHFNRDDWHYALASTLSRESVNPRPTEYRLIHRLTRRYIIGSVSYSEGVSDDINKMVWSDMDFFPEVPLRETLLDYARVFFYGVPAETVVDGILGLERNWEGDPAENPHIESTLGVWRELRGAYPRLMENWRFVQCLFRADCDALVRRRRLFELDLIEKAKTELEKGFIEDAVDTLATGFDDEYTALREEISVLAETLFNKIGLQLDVEHYFAKSWERGATLETIDLPVTDRQWLLKKAEAALRMPGTERAGFIGRVLNRNKVASDEFYFSLAEHGFDVLGVPQKGEFYINYQGDRPNVNNGGIPMSMLKLYDHYTFNCRLGGFTPGADYLLRVTFSSQKYPVLIHHNVTANGVTVYDGPQFGGEKDEAFDSELLAPGFETATYKLPARLFKNGCIDLEIGEPIAGVMLSEFWILKDSNG